MKKEQLKQLFFEVCDANQKLFEARGNLQNKEESLVRFLVEEKAWHFLKPIMPRVKMEITH
ncbi:hypothetical protein FJZ41_03785 [Candidatus Shapirobacteria bacterium]|nr:hypothetical protein [Candidatus Shapirobacteria bacterium]